MTRFSRSAPAKPGVPRARDREVDVRGEGNALGVDAENGFATAHVGTVHRDPAVETTGAEDRGIEDVGAVRRRDDDDAFVRLEAVHLDEELVQRLLALVVTPPRPAPR